MLLLLFYNSFSCLLHSAASRSSARDLFSVSVFMSSSKRSSTKLLCHYPVIATTIAGDSSRIDDNELGAEELCLSLSLWTKSTQLQYLIYILPSDQGSLRRFFSASLSLQQNCCEYMGFCILSLITSSEMVLSLSLCANGSLSSISTPLASTCSEPNRLKLLKSILDLFFFLSAINL